MNNHQKLLSAAVSLLLTLALVSCGGDGEDTDTYTDTDAASDIDTADTTLDIIDIPDVDIPDDGIPRERVYRHVSYTERYGDYVSECYRFGYDAAGRVTYVRDAGETEPFIEITYDDNGDLSELFNTDPDNSYRMKYIYESGKLVREEKYLRRGALPPLEVTEYTYGADGKLTATLNIRYEYTTAQIYTQTQSAHEYAYDANGNLIAEYYVKGEERTLSKEYTYDEYGNLLRKCSLSENGKTYDAFEYTYDEDGNMLSESYYYYFDDSTYELPPLQWRYEYTYDKHGNKLKLEYYDSFEKCTAMTEYKYDESGRVIFEKYLSEYEKHGYEEEHTYDENGNLKVSLYRDLEDGSESVCEYTYREFYLTEEEIAQALQNDAIIEWHIPYYNTHLN